MIRRKRNRIYCFKDSFRNLVHNEEIIASSIREGYISLFTTSKISTPISIWNVTSWSNSLTRKEGELLSYPVTRKEVFEGLGRMKPFKAPGPDGMHTSFYQRNWNIVKEVVVREVCLIFSSGVMPNHLNQTLITLIPKCTGANYLGSFRPISLCNTIYKIVTKIIVQRIRPLLDKLVSPLQIAFVPGRRGLDNMIIMQELIHTMSTKKGNQGYMAIKIDLEKAYDRLEWHFIRDVLNLYNLPPDTIKLIMSCISGSSILVLLNGGKLGPFLPSRGIRQGDL